METLCCKLEAACCKSVGSWSLTIVWRVHAAQFGQLGIGTTEDALSPTLLAAGLTGESVAQLACGWRHTVAVTSGGRFFAWGRGVNGQLGIGSIVDMCAAVLGDGCLFSLARRRQRKRGDVAVDPVVAGTSRWRWCT